MSFEMTSAAEILAFWAIAGYLLGAIPFGIVTARALGLGDLRQIGSGNIGATNVLRTGSKLGAALTLIGDAGKAGAAVLLARALAEGPDIDTALADYAAQRHPRTEKIVAAANSNARIYHLGGASRLLTHAGLRLVGRVAPGLMLRRFDWLYGHDVTR